MLHRWIGSSAIALALFWHLGCDGGGPCDELEGSRCTMECVAGSDRCAAGCPDGESCTMNCPRGGCEMDCRGTSCRASCDGGGCTIYAAGEYAVDVSCDGGDCIIDAGSSTFGESDVHCDRGCAMYLYAGLYRAECGSDCQISAYQVEATCGSDCDVTCREADAEDVYDNVLPFACGLTCDVEESCSCTGDRCLP